MSKQNLHTITLGWQVRNPLDLQEEHASDIGSVCEFISLQLRSSFQDGHAFSSLALNCLLSFGFVGVSKGLSLLSFFVFV